MTVEKMFSKLNYVKDVEQVVFQKISRDEKAIKEIAETAYQGENFFRTILSTRRVQSFSVL